MLGSKAEKEEEEDKEICEWKDKETNIVKEKE